MSKAKKVQKVAASLTVYGIPDMTAKGRTDIAVWLQHLAADFRREPESFSKTFRARYMYEPRKGEKK